MPLPKSLTVSPTLFRTTSACGASGRLPRPGCCTATFQPLRRACCPCSSAKVADLSLSAVDGDGTIERCRRSDCGEDQHGAQACPASTCACRNHLLSEPQDEFGMGSFNVFSAHGPAISPLVAADQPGERCPNTSMPPRIDVCIIPDETRRAEVTWGQQRWQRRRCPHRQRIRRRRHRHRRVCSAVQGLT